ncbi:MAG: hypothetical protein ABSE07_06805 [Methanoregula sp.]
MRSFRARRKLVDLTKDFTSVEEKRHGIELLEQRGDAARLII